MLPSLQPYKGKNPVGKWDIHYYDYKDRTLQKFLCKIKFPLPAKDLMVNLSEDKLLF